ncbi:MAG TPA: MarR family transcriptional regulator [Steroidobacteraceae bacterium]|jgi:DNA-binding MarR family transcriptional regulator|nr:MarR family transcriptional regulator [Steroidobacteraceae bacterium]
MHNTHNYDSLVLALIDLIGMLNSPRQDEILLRESGVTLDRALFPLLVRIGMAPSLNVGALAEQVGRDQSTVSRQTAKLEALGLIRRRAGKADQRAREAIITAAGKGLVQSIAVARRRLLDRILAQWSAADVQALARLNRRFADAMKAALDG